MSDGSEEDEEGSGALTAEIDGEDALVVFTNETLAGQFVKEQEDLFEDSEEVEGLVVDGEALLEYLPEGFGMLIDPEVEESAMIEPELAAQVVSIKY
jgi:excinuclease UvrABC helicase subunit UvrB